MTAARLPSVAEEVGTALARDPDLVAVLTDEVEVRRGTLGAASRSVALRCIAAGLRPAEPVVLLLPLDPDGVVGYLGGVRSGGAVVALDPALPDAHIADIVGRTRARIAVVTEPLADRARLLGLAPVVAGTAHVEAPDGVELTFPDGGALSRIAFTSGSTGRAKGIARTHDEERRGERSGAARRETADDRIALIVPFGPSPSRSAVLAMVATGAAVCPYDVRTRGLSELPAFLERHRITSLQVSVGVFRALTALLGDGRLTGARLVHLTGEAIDRTDVLAFQEHFAPDAQLRCTYGLSEAGGVGSVTFGTSDAVPEGPLLYATMRSADVRIERRDGSPAALGETGEIVLRGARVARGYFDDPALTAARFFVEPDGTRGYRSGDLGRFVAADTLEVLGRADDQVTVRGTNVHLSTVEAALREVDGVDDGAVVAVPDDKHGFRLVAFVQPSGRVPPTTAALRRALAERLPAAMIPSAFRSAAALPRLASGKLDRARLEADGTSALPAGTTDRAAAPGRRPATSTERIVAAAIARVLALDTIGTRVRVEDDFFDLGGDSLTAVELLAALEADLGVRLDVADLARDPTVIGLVGAVDGRVRAQRGPFLSFGADQPGRPLVLYPGTADSALHFRALALRLGRPVHVRRGRGIDEPASTIPRFARLADEEAAILSAFLPPGAFAVGGHSAGGVLALEIGRRLQAEGRPAELVVLLDSTAPSRPGVRAVRQVARRLDAGTITLARGLGRAVRNRVRIKRTPISSVPADDHRALRDRVWMEATYARTTYRARPYSGRAVLLRATERWGASRPVPADLGWARLVDGELTVIDVTGNHTSFIEPPLVDDTARALAAPLAAALRDRVEPTRTA